MTRIVCFVAAWGRRSDFLNNDFHDERAKERQREMCFFCSFLLDLHPSLASILVLRFGRSSGKLRWKIMGQGSQGRLPAHYQVVTDLWDELKGKKGSDYE